MFSGFLQGDIMVIKRISKAIEGTVLIGANVLGKIDYLTRLPVKIMKEAQLFIKRNSLAVVAYTIDEKAPIHKCCENCLGAHLMRKADSLGLDNKAKENIVKAFDNHIGHEGYYLDKGRLVRVSSDFSA